MVGLPFDTTASTPGATFATRPVVMGTRGVVTSGHYLATAAGFRIMEQGGNAFDAAVNRRVNQIEVATAEVATTLLAGQSK